LYLSEPLALQTVKNVWEKKVEGRVGGQAKEHKNTARGFRNGLLEATAKK